MRTLYDRTDPTAGAGRHGTALASSLLDLGMTGSQILHYKIGDRLGAGGMGEVYRAEDLRLGRQVALKFLSGAGQDDAERRARFLREARAASSLRSPNVAATYDIGEHDGSIFIVMELVEGHLLTSLIERGPLDVIDSVDVAMQVADALDEAHGRGIVHRDIKSANLMLTERGLVKVLDFGLAKFVDPLGQVSEGGVTRLDQRTVAGVVLGTVSYMSPEQALGRPIDHRSDLFSLGIVLYEMLTGRIPFDGENMAQVIDRIIHHSPAPVSRFNSAIPSELEGIVRKLLEKDPGERFQTARDLYLDLRRLRRSLEDEASGSGPVRAVSRVSGQRSLEVDASPRAPERPSAAVAVMTFANITGEAGDDWIGSGIAETVTSDLKNIQGLSVIGRERIYERLKHLATQDRREFDERVAIQVGRMLDAAWIIGGAYQRVGDVVRITSRLVDVETGALVKTLKVDGRIDGIFDLQDKIVFELTQWLNLKLADSEISQIERNETQSVEAYENYSRGMMNLRLASRDSLDRAMNLFEKALALDANYASAAAALGLAYELKGAFLGIREFADKAIEWERRALELNPRLVNAHAWLGDALLNAGRHDEAIQSIREAIRLEPGNARAHMSLARAYWVGKGLIDEAIAEFDEAVRINPEGGYGHLQLAMLHTVRGDFEKAEASCQAAIALQEQYMSGTEGLLIVGAHTRLGYVYYRQGRYDEAIREYERELAFLSSSDHALRERSLIELNQKLGAALLRKQQPEDAERRFAVALRAYERRVAQGSDDPFTKYYIACLYALKGDAETAIRHLRATFDQLGTWNRLRAATDPDFDGIRAHPEFVALLQPASSRS